MGKKRKAGEGTLRLRKDGRWEGRIVVDYDENGKRHQLLGFVHCISKHHSLIAGAENIFVLSADFQSLVNALRNIGRLAVKNLNYLSGITVKSKLGSIVADAVDGPSYDLLNIDLSC